MAVQLSNILEYLEEIAPLNTALGWDNSGLQVGNVHKPIERVLLALDITPSVMEEAMEKAVDLIITHHPMIFRPLKKIDYATTTGQLVKKLVTHDIALFAAHTNLDRSSAGTGKALAELIGLKDIKPYVDDEKDEMNMVITGAFEPSLSGQEVVNLLKEKLITSVLRIIGDIMETKTVAIIPGSGGSMLGKLDGSFDIIITGEVSYHEALDAASRNDVIIVLGHYVSEKPVMYKLSGILKEKFPELVISVSEKEDEPYITI
jgi:GTP cyclohydrolase I